MKKQILLLLLSGSLNIVMASEQVNPDVQKVMAVRDSAQVGRNVQLEFENQLDAQYAKEFSSRADQKSKVVENVLPNQTLSLVLLNAFNYASKSLGLVHQSINNACKNSANKKENLNAVIKINGLNDQLGSLLQKFLALEKEFSGHEQNIEDNIVLYLAFFRALDAKTANNMQSIVEKIDLAASGISDINIFLGYQSEMKKGISWKWSHNPEFREQIERNGLIFAPMTLKIDRVFCESCKSEAYGLRITDRPNYYHKSDCQFRPNEVTHRGASPIQKIRYALANNLIYNEQISLALGNTISLGSVNLIANYCDINDLNQYLEIFRKFYDKIGQLPGILKFADYYKESTKNRVWALHI